MPCISRMSYSTIKHLQLQLQLALPTSHHTMQLSLEGLTSKLPSGMKHLQLQLMRTSMSLCHLEPSSETAQLPYQIRDMGLAATRCSSACPGLPLMSGERAYIYVTLLDTAVLAGNDGATSGTGGGSVRPSRTGRCSCVPSPPRPTAAQSRPLKH